MKWRLYLFIFSVLFLSITAAGCGKKSATSSDRAAKEPAAPRPVTQTPAVNPEPEGIGSIRGRIISAGGASTQEEVNSSADPVCSAHGPIYSQEKVVSANGGVRYSFVYLKAGIKGNFPVPQQPVVVDQKGCAYEPHVMGLQVNQPLEILNSDSTLHNVHAIPQTNTPFNVGMPLQGMKSSKKFSRPEVMVKIKCDVHPWMSAYVGVLEHPFFSVTDENGSFVINNVPAGHYIIAFWHESFGTQEKEIDVLPSKEVQADFSIS